MLRYLNRTRDLGLLYSNRIGERPRLYNIWTDTTWGTEDDRKSVIGLAATRYGAVYNWFLRRQKLILLSLLEAEIIARSEGGKEIAWIEKITGNIKERGKTPFIPTLFIDNQSRVT